MGPIAVNMIAILRHTLALFCLLGLLAAARESAAVTKPHGPHEPHGKARKASEEKSKEAGDEEVIPVDQYTLFDEVISWFKGREKMKRSKSESKSSWLILPTIMSEPTIGFGAGASARYDFKLFDKPDTSYSALALTGVGTTAGQIMVGLSNMLYTPGDRFIIAGLTEWAKFPRQTYGLGGDSPAITGTAISMQQLDALQTVLYEAFKNVYFGLGYRVTWFYGVEDTRAKALQDGIQKLRDSGGDLTEEDIAEILRKAEEAGIPIDTLTSEEFIADVKNPDLTPEQVQVKHLQTVFQEYPHGTGSNSLVSGFALTARYDSRDNWRNASKGFFAGVTGGFYPTWLGSTNTWYSLFVDFRTYIRMPIRWRHVLAFRTFGWFSFGDVHYFGLPGTMEEFGQRSGRGYYRGRYRGQHMLYGEIEYRATLWRWLGANAFFNVHSVTEPDTKKFKYVIPAGGGGLRFLINREAGMNITADFAAGKDGSFGFYLAVNEAF